MFFMFAMAEGSFLRYPLRSAQRWAEVFLRFDGHGRNRRGGACNFGWRRTEEAAARGTFACRLGLIGRRGRRVGRHLRTARRRDRGRLRQSPRRHRRPGDVRAGDACCAGHYSGDMLRGAGVAIGGGGGGMGRHGG